MQYLIAEFMKKIRIVPILSVTKTIELNWCCCDCLQIVSNGQVIHTQYLSMRTIINWELTESIKQKIKSPNARLVVAFVDEGNTLVADATKFSLEKTCEGNGVRMWLFNFRHYSCYIITFLLIGILFMYTEQWQLSKAMYCFNGHFYV